jgi:2-polyprenyl-3-methyl-5-hydroxy-6-metoxy-1,4-benzoquinol methylase
MADTDPKTEQHAFDDVACNLCGANDARQVYERPYELASPGSCGDFAATTDEFEGYGRIARCNQCGLTYTNPRPSPSYLLRGYENCEDDTYLLESSSRSMNAHVSMNTIKRYVPGGRLLDVGASVGYFLNAARVDFDVYGLEPSEWACGIARSRFKLEVRQATLDEHGFEPESFDVVTMIDVIEHVTDPKRVIAQAIELLKPGGVLYLVTPDIGSLSAFLMRSYWWGLRPAHIYYFDRRTLSRMLREQGLEIELTKSFGRIFTWGYWYSRLQNYPAFLRVPVGWLIDALKMHSKLLYIDTRDSVEICARKV